VKSSRASCSTRLLGSGDSATVSALPPLGTCSPLHNAVSGRSVTAAAVATTRDQALPRICGRKVSQRCKCRLLGAETPLFRFGSSSAARRSRLAPISDPEPAARLCPGDVFSREELRRELSRFGGSATRTPSVVPAVGQGFKVSRAHGSSDRPCQVSLSEVGVLSTSHRRAKLRSWAPRVASGR
jgi:hypothetical protein